MTVKLALLKSGEDVIADIKEVVTEDEKLSSYLFTYPFIVKLLSSQVLMEESDSEDKREFSVSFFPWIPLSADKDILVSKDWVVSIVEPTEMVKKSYEERMNGRGRSTKNDSGSSINESVEFNN
jgi:hypothetical protein